MKIRSAIMISGALALMLVSGCQSSPEPEPEPESAPTPAAGQSGTVEASEPEYSADLELTVTFPDKTVYTSTDNGVTWTAGEKTVSYNDMAAFLTVIYPEPISVTGEIPVAMTIHNNNHNTDMLIGGSEIEVLRRGDSGEWTPAEYADKTIEYAFTAQADLIFLSRDYYEDLSIYEPVGGRYRLTKSFTIGGDEAYGLLNPSDPGGKYIMSAEFNALP